MCFYRNNIWHTQLGCVPSFHGCGRPFCLGLCFLNLLNCLHHWLLQLFFILLISSTLCFPWFSIFEHLFFGCLTSCCNINIHHIHIYSDCFYFSNRLNFCYCHRFPMKHFLHLSKLWTVCHFVSFYTRKVAYTWRFLLWFLTLWCCLFGYHYGLFLFACFHIVIIHSIIRLHLVNLLCIILCFWWYYLFNILWYWKCTPYFYSSHFFFT